MPNHVQNKLTFDGPADAVSALRDAIRTEEDGRTYPIAFKNIIPPPDGMEPRSVPVAIEGYAQFVMSPNDPKHRFYGDIAAERGNGPWAYDDENWALFIEYLNNIRNHGHATLMSWARENWDTKWGAYNMPDRRDTDAVIHFQTAWSAPHPVIQALSEQHPGIQITHEWADEDIGHNAGRRIYHSGEIVGEWNIGDGSERAKRFAYKMHDRTPEPA